MSKAIEQARRESENTAFHEWWKSSGHADDPIFTLTMENCAHAAWQERAALSSSPAQPGAIKPLEWRDHPIFGGDDLAVANIAEWGEHGHKYQVGRDADAPGYKAFLAPMHGSWFWTSPCHDTLEAAKAAAQKDFEARIRSALSVPLPEIEGGDKGEPHTDDLAVDRFAAAMKAKLAEKRAQGYHGWDDPEDCTIEHLSNLLVKHVGKGDPVDVGNFAMMIHQRGERIK